MAGPVELVFFSVRGPLDRKTIGKVLSSLPGDRVNVLIDRDSAVSDVHIRSAFMHAARSILTGKCRAKDPSMEVLRYVAGSRQVGEGVSLAGPNERTKVLVIATAPDGWPVQGDGDHLPEVCEGAPSAPGIDRSILDPLEGLGHWGGGEAARRILSGDDGGPDIELAVLERIAMADLR